MENQVYDVYFNCGRFGVPVLASRLSMSFSDASVFLAIAHSFSTSSLHVPGGGREGDNMALRLPEPTMVGKNLGILLSLCCHIDRPLRGKRRIAMWQHPP
uniref:Uncharacterized protein n=1 Tax=Lygus hesperus TaxID=30085 RepID=A0A146LTF9_LYGHE